MANPLYLQVADKIMNMIHDETYKPGEMLPSERKLAADNMVSRNVIRNALKLLDAEGYIELRPGEGAYIGLPRNEKYIEAMKRMLLSSKTSFMEILEVRETLEKDIIGKAIEYVDESGLTKLEKIYETMEILSEKRQYDSFVANDALFHEAIAKMIPNQLYVTLLMMFYNITGKKFFMLTQTLDVTYTNTQKEHREIIDALQRRDNEAAVEAMSAHMENIRLDFTLLEG